MIIPKGLICPICQGELTKIDNSLKCSLNHSYDFAKNRFGLSTLMENFTAPSGKEFSDSNGLNI